MKTFLCVVVCVMTFLAGLTLAQEQTGELTGIVRETGHEPLPGVAVKATSPALIREAAVVTDQTGRYRLPHLPPGKYTLTFTLPGFTTIIREEVVVGLGKTLSLDIVMTPSAITAETVVIGQAPVVDVTKSSTTYDINKENFDKLPKGRDFQSIISIASGVNEETAQLNGTSFDGASSSENMYYFDGMDTTELNMGTSGQGMVFENVEEVQLKDSGYEAQYGGSTGGVINVITRSGGNQYHGEALFYVESSHLSGGTRPNLLLDPFNEAVSQYVTPPKDYHSLYEVGFDLGGYLIKDRLWFFGSYIPSFQNTNRLGVFVDSPDSTAHFVESQKGERASFKLTYQPLAKLRMNFSFNDNSSQWRGSLPTQDGLSDPSYDYSLDGQNMPAWTASFNADYTASNNFLIGVRAGWYRANTYNVAQPPAAARYYFIYSNADIPGVPADMVHGADWHSYPYDSGFAYSRDIMERWSAAIDATYYTNLAGEHAFKAGFNWNRLHRDQFDAIAHQYYYFYWGVPYSSPNLGTVPTPYGYLDAVDPLGYIKKPYANRYNAYIQDSWTLFKRLTLNIGVRAEYEVYPSFLDPASSLAREHPEFLNPFIKFNWGDKIAPRLGFAYDILGNSKLKVFGSYGIYYDVMKLHMSAAVGGSQYVDHFYIIPASLVQNFQLGNFDYVNNPPAELASYFLESLNEYIPSFGMFQPDMKPLSKMEVTFGFQAKVSEDVSFSARFLHNNLLWAIEDIGVETPEGSSYFIGNPGSAWINQMYASSGLIPQGVTCPKAKRTYDSLDLGLEKRFSKSWLAGFHYTLSRLWGNYSGLASSDEHGRQDPNTAEYFDGWYLAYTEHFPQQSTGLLNTDRPHQFKVYGAYTFGFGLTVGTYIFASSGTPESTAFLLDGKDIFYPLGREDMGRTPFIWRADVYADYKIKLTGKYAIQLNANIYNVTNNRIAQRLWNTYTLQNIYLTNQQIANGFDYLQVTQDQGLMLDPRYGKPFYYQSPIAMRLGIKFMF